MKKKHNKTRRYIVIEFDGTTTRACTFRSPELKVIVNETKGLFESEARLHPDDQYDQNKGIRIALERLGFDVSDNPFNVIFEGFQKVLAKAILTGDPE